MDAPRKPRSDSALKTLPEERQAQVAALLASKSLAEVKAELAKDGLVTSTAALSEFFSWWQVRQSLQRREDRITGILEQVKADVPEVDQDKLFRLGQSLFGTLAIAEQDGQQWYNTQRLALAAQKLELEDRRIQLLEAKLAEVQKVVGEAKAGGITPETLTKIEEAARLL